MEKRGSKKKADEDKGIKGDWNNWGEYMHAKVQKLDAQFKEDVPKRAQDGDVPKIFDKIVIGINGYTVPPVDELRRLVYLHGGRYLQYYTKRSVTHVIATNLPNSKIQELRDELVVHPNWILDSIKAGTLLPVNQYLLYQGRKAAQKVLNFTSKPSSTSTITKRSPGVVPVEAPLLNLESPQGSPSVDMPSLYSTSIPPLMGEASTCGFLASATQEPTPELENDKTGRDAGEKDLHSVAKEDILRENSITVNEGQDFDDDGDGITFQISDKDGAETCAHPVQRSTNLEGEISKNVPENRVLKKPFPSGLPRAGDANFVSEFYNNSRLHYLSTWGAEFKKYTSDIIKSSAVKGWKSRGTGRVGSHGRVIMHIDMDSFFVSVTLRDQPHLRGKPIAVCHAGKSSSSTEQGETRGIRTVDLLTPVQSSLRNPAGEQFCRRIVPTE